MKKLSRVLAGCFFLCIAAALSTGGQTISPVSDWMTVRSDDGVFSAQVPTSFDAFYEKDGFSVSDGYRTVQLREARYFNSYTAGTLVSFESYESVDPGFASSRMRESEKRNGKETEIKTADGLKFKQIEKNGNGSYVVRRFVVLKDNLYVLTVASRVGETPEIKRFLDSVSFSKPTKDIPTSHVRVSSLKITPVKVSFENDDKPSGPVAPALPKADDPGEKKFMVVVKPHPYFTDAARSANETGAVLLRVGFTPNGGVDAIRIKKTLREGLVRQCLFAALRMRVLPLEQQNVARSVTKLIEYSFSIY